MSKLGKGRWYLLTSLLLCCYLPGGWAQQTAQVFGYVTDANNDKPIDFATVYCPENKEAVQTDDRGFFLILVPANSDFIINVSRVGFREANVAVSALPVGARNKLGVSLVRRNTEIAAEIIESRIENMGMITESVEEMKLLPTTSGNFETILPAIALGTSSGTGGELSSQYNVRGGNYDENLVYINDFEIYRPQLIRTGQQEGLTFPNVDLIRSLSFSSGGFESRFGDKMSSVLDIQYKRPDSLRASLSGSLLGSSFHLEGSSKLGKSNYKKFRYLLGARYKTTKYILGSLDIDGEYEPNFYDIQGFFSLDLSRDWQLGFLGNFNRSEYAFRPSTRTTALGLIDFALQLFTVYEGSEFDDFTTSFGGVSLTYLPDRDRNPLFLKFLGSTYQSFENERLDIIGYYRLGQVESDLGSDDFGDVVAVLGTGTQHTYVRNYFTGNVTNFEHKGGIELQLDNKDWTRSKSHFVQWGAKYQHETFNDQINEWERLDSAGYSLPYDPNAVQLESVLKTQNEKSSNRISAFLQNTYSYERDSVVEMKLTLGARATYWDLNNEFNISPRAQLLIRPLKKKANVTYRFSTGLYVQPPFYRELRNPQGEINTDVLAQKSAHILGGATWTIPRKDPDMKPFRFITEVYYKYLWDLVSYEVDNVRIRYSGLNDATGYVAGIDFRFNGEFVEDAESWINLSFLTAREKLDGVQHLKRDIGDPEAREVNNVPRPTDQFMTLSTFFQDYLPRNKNFKMHLIFTLGTGLPFGLRGGNREYRNTYRYSPYHRVDIGFSVLLWDRQWKAKQPKNPLRFARATWLSLEVFNLMRVYNEASNTWIKTIYGTQYAVPNYLTSRRINLRLRMEF